MAPPIARDDGIPVHVLTGFLGSGKTTLLRHVLSDPALHDTAVVINEFGEVGLDHLLVRQVAEDVVLLGSGCLCCTVRDDLVSTLANLRALAAEGEIPRFRRLAIETTGLADPVPIAAAVLSEGRLTPHYRLGRIVTTVDALCGSLTLEAHSTAAVQVAVANRIVLTKTDLADKDGLDTLQQRLSALNGSAMIVPSAPDRMPASDQLFGGLWENDAEQILRRSSVTGTLHSGHTHGITSFTTAFDEPVRWPDFIEWLDLLLMSRGDSILRVKGLLAVEGDESPRVIQGVQHVVYPAETLATWPDHPGRSWLVFIARDLTQSAVERSLREVLGVTPLGPGRMEH